MILKKSYDGVNREPLWHVLRMYDVVIKLCKGITCMAVDNLTNVRVIQGETGCFRIYSVVK